MTSYNDIPTLKRRVEELERRMAETEGAPRLSYAAITGGGINLYDPGTGALVGRYGEQWDGTYGAVTLGGPTPPIPSKPIVVPVQGGLDIIWNGNFSEFEVAPMDFARVEVHSAIYENFTLSRSTLIGTFESPQGGQQFFAFPPGETRYVRMLTRAHSGKASAGSAAESGTPLAIEAETPIPATPEILQVMPDWQYSQTSWKPRATFGLEWTPITTDTNGNPIEIAGYEIWSRISTLDWELARVTTGPSAYSPTGTIVILTDYELNLPYEFKVRAMTNRAASEFSEVETASVPASSVVETLSEPLTSVTSQLSTIALKYEGVGVNGQAPGPYVSRVEIGTKTLPGDEYTVVHSFPAAQKYSSPIPIPNVQIGNAYYVAARFVTASGFQGAWEESDDSPVTVVGVVDADLVDTTIQQSVQDAVDTANEAYTAVGNKNTVHYASSMPPSTGNRVGDTWFHTGAGNQIFHWDGDSWEPVALDESALSPNVTGAIDNAVTAANGKNVITYSTDAPSGNGTRVGDTWFRQDGSGKIIGQWQWSGSTWAARTIESALIANLDAAKINTGTLSADRIGTNSITAEKMATGTITAESGIVQSLSAGVLTSGFIDSARIQSGSISAEKLVVGAVTPGNIAKNPSFDVDTANWSLQSGVVTRVASSANARTGAAHLRAYRATQTTGTLISQTGVPVQPGQIYEIGIWVRRIGAVSGIGNFTIYAAAYTGTNVPTLTTQDVKSVLLTSIPTDRYAYISVEMKISTALVEPKLAFGFGQQTAASSQPIELYLDDAYVNVAGLISIGDGQVTAPKIAAGAVTAEGLAANAITAGKINAGAIDGMIITGAVLQTSPAGQRVSLDVSGLRAYNNLSQEVTSIDAATGRFTTSDGFFAGNIDMWDGTISGEMQLHSSGAIKTYEGNTSAMFLDNNTFTFKNGEIFNVRINNSFTGVEASAFRTFTDDGSGSPTHYLTLQADTISSTSLVKVEAPTIRLSGSTGVYLSDSAAVTVPNPTASNSATTKAYVDALVSQGGGGGGGAGGSKLVGFAQLTTNAPTITTDDETTVISQSVTVVAGKTYRVTFTGVHYGSVVTDVLALRVRAAGLQLQGWYDRVNSSTSATSTSKSFTLIGYYLATTTATISFTGTVQRTIGSGTITMFGSDDLPRSLAIELMDNTAEATGTGAVDPYYGARWQSRLEASATLNANSYYNLTYNNTIYTSPAHNPMGIIEYLSVSGEPRYYVQRTGTYLITYSLQWNAASGGSRKIHVFLNNDSAPTATDEVPVPNSSGIQQRISLTVHLTAGQYFRIGAISNSVTCGILQGPVAGGSGYAASMLQIVYLGNPITNYTDPSDTGWVPVEVASPWVNDSGDPFMMRRMGKKVTGRGRLSGTFNANTTYTIGQAPPGMAPPAGKSSMSAIFTTGAFVAWCNVTPAGVINIHLKSPWPGGSGVLEFNGIDFTVD